MFGPDAKDTKKYISLQEAAKYSEIYSQGYLSLRARQGKLKAVKLGRNWVTTKEWVSEYVNNENNVKASELKATESKLFASMPVVYDKPLFDKFTKGLTYSLSGCVIIVSFVLGFSDYKIGTEKIIAKISNFDLAKNKEISFSFASQFFENISNSANKAGGVGNDFKNFMAEKSLNFLNQTKRVAGGLSLEYQNTLRGVFGDIGQIFSGNTKQILKISKNGVENLLSHSEKLRNIDSQEIWQLILQAKKNTSDYVAGFPLFVKDEILEKSKTNFMNIGVFFENSANLFIDKTVKLSLEVKTQVITSFLREKGVFSASLLDVISQSKQGILNGRSSFIERLRDLKVFLVINIKKGAMFVVRPWLEHSQ